MDLKHLKIKQIAKMERDATYAVKFVREPGVAGLAKLKELFESIAINTGCKFIIFGDYLEFPEMVPVDSIELVVEKVLRKHGIIPDADSKVV